MTSYVPAEWGDVAPSVTLETQLKDEVLEPGKSYEIRWSSWFIGTITVRACTGAFYVCLRRVRVFTIIGAVRAFEGVFPVSCAREDAEGKILRGLLCPVSCLTGVEFSCDEFEYWGHRCRLRLCVHTYNMVGTSSVGCTLGGAEEKCPWICMSWLLFSPY